MKIYFNIYFLWNNIIYNYFLIIIYFIFDNLVINNKLNKIDRYWVSGFFSVPINIYVKKKYLLKKNNNNNKNI